MYQLYYSPGACSLAVHTVLNMLEAPFALHKISIEKGEHRSEAFLAVNPRGQVPVLVDVDKRVLSESAAIMLFLMEKYKSPLLPTEEWPRTQALQWLLFCNSNLHQAYSTYFMMNRFLKDDAAKPAVCALAVKRIQNLWHEIERQLEQSTWLAGEKMTGADVLLAVIANWSHLLKPSVTLGALTQELCARVANLPAFAKALQTEGVHYTLSGKN